MTRRVLAALAATTWLAGCVSILGVDPDDHADVVDLVCECSNAPARCRGVVGAVLSAKPEIEEQVVECAAASEGCASLDACLQEARVCSDPGGPCTPDASPGRVSLTCCTGTCTDEGECAAACAGANAECGPGVDCCPGTRCLGGACRTCGAHGDPCDEGFVCCDADTPLVCTDGGCRQCVDDVVTTCTDEFPCCSTGTCPETGKCLLE